MSQEEYRAFMTTTLRNGVDVSTSGAVHFVFMDWRHIGDLIAVGSSIYGAMLNLVVWNKSNAGQGAFYRSQHELIGVFRVGDSPHRNNVELGRFGRNRSNVWTYAGVNTFGGAVSRMLTYLCFPRVSGFLEAVSWAHSRLSGTGFHPISSAMGYGCISASH
jgi:hypothetical protein